MNIENYLNKIQHKESVGGFAIDSFPTLKKKKKIIKITYPNEDESVINKDENGL